MISPENATTPQQDFEPCHFPKLNKTFLGPEVRLSSSTGPFSPRLLRTFCKSRKVSIESIIQTAWALVLRSYTGSDTTLFGFQKVSSQDLDWLCADHFSLSERVEDHFERVFAKDVVTIVPSSWIVKQSETDGSARELYNSLVTFNEDNEKAAFDTTNYSIVAVLELSKENLSITIEHNLSSFDVAQGQRVVETIRNTLSKIISEPTKRIRDINLLTEQDVKQIWEWNDSIPKDPKTCVHHLLKEQAERTPDAQAISSWDGDMAYSELDQYASTLGSHLSAMGVVPNMIIPICFEKSKWTIVSMIAVLKAGAAFTTLDPAQPRSRLDDTIIETRSNIILVSSSLAERFEGQSWHVVADIPELCQQKPSPPYSAASLSVQPTDLSYVAFTSGSTGKPKGVAHQHQASCTSIKLRMRDGSDSGYGPEKRIMQFASQAFAASVVEVFKTLGNGGCICIPSEKVRLNNMAEFMKENNITRVFLTPALLKLFTPEDFPTLETLLVGGEPVLPDLIATWAPRVRLIEAIGMTEGVAITTAIDSNGLMTRKGQTLSGVPWIVNPDDHNKLVPIGALGELMVEGPCLAKEYLHDEEKTNAAFVEAPKWALTKEYPGRRFRLYRTGDMARYYSDGIVRLLGRRDNRVKLNGQRIELGDVESHMQKNLPQSMTVAAEVVTVSQAGKEKSFLVGFIFASNEIGKVDGAKGGLIPRSESLEILALLPTLRKRMELALPAYMVPTVFLPFKRRPTNTSGKLDRKLLRQIVSELSTEEVMAYNQTGESKDSLSNETEKVLASLWGSLFNLNANSFGSNANFLMYGGDSLQAIKLARLAQDSGISLAPSDILQNPVLRNMSVCAKQLGDEHAKPTTNGIQKTTFSAEDISRIKDMVGPYKIEQTSFATDWQSWSVYTGLLRTRGWTDYLTFDFKGSLDTARLQNACKSLLGHLSILRTVFAVDRRRVFQVVLENYPFQFETHEATSGESRQSISERIFDVDATSDSILGEPIVRFSLISSSDKHRLLIRTSHAQYDAMSLIPLFTLLKSAYQNVELPPSLTFINFVDEHRGDIKKSEPFWKDLLQGSKMTEIIPCNTPTYSNVVDQAIRKTIPLPLMQSHGITTASLVLSAWAIVLAKVSRSSDVVFGRLTSGRNSTLPGVKDVIGPCMNITPIRALIVESTDMLSFLHGIQNQHLSSLRYENVGFRHIIENCTDWAPYTRFSSIVNHVHIEPFVEDLSALSEDLKYTFDVFEPIHDKSDLWLQTKPVGDQMEVELRFSRKSISAKLAEEALQLFCHVIQQALRAVEEPLSTITNRKITSSAGAIETLSVVEAAWSRVLESEEKTLVGIDMDTPFYHIWGDLVAAAALCKIYRDAGFKVEVEDVIDHPTIRQQVVLLSRGN